MRRLAWDQRPDVGMAWGAYGFEIAGFDRPELFLRTIGPGWPLLSVVRTGVDEMLVRDPHRRTGQLYLEDQRAEFWLSDRASFEVLRPIMQVRFATEERLPDEFVAHPFLSVPAVVAAYWIGRLALHGGACVISDRLWAMCGTKEAGKSSAMAWFLSQGIQVLTDDLLVTEGLTAFAGPRTIDLRDEAAAHFGGERVDILGWRTRWRLRPELGTSSATLSGFVHLEWGDDVRVERVTPEERLRYLLTQSVLGPDLIDAKAYLDLATLPAWRFTRPRRMDMIDPSFAQLLDVLD